MTLPTCAVCGGHCRGSCKRCGARLCHLHKPKTGKMKCPKCPRTGSIARSYQQPQQGPYGPMPTMSYPPMPKPAPINTYYQPAPDFEHMTPEDLMQYAQDRKDWLEHKMKRERDYLAKRAGRGRRTLTDINYENDQPYERDILFLLDYLINMSQQEIGHPKF